KENSSRASLDDSSGAVWPCDRYSLDKKKRKASTTSSSSSETTSSSSGSSSSSDSSAEESSEDECKSKRKKQTKKKLKEKEKEGKTAGEELPGPSLEQWQKEAGADPGPALTDEQKSRIQAMKPMTKEEWDARQSVIRRVVDPETGRTRLIKGDGEVLEEIVTKERHKEINKQATRGDGLSFQMRTGMLQ
uniref:ADP-ribosylation factor-like protein 6-interacting protein 4 n=1 Tax=Varanus komodoensis TaxID=61221 RepID=A0A8D2LLQ3_VARKO